MVLIAVEAMLAGSRLPAVDDSMRTTTGGFNDWRGRGYDDFVPEEVTKIVPSGGETTCPLHGRQTCPEFIAFDQGVGQICLR